MAGITTGGSIGAVRLTFVLDGGERIDVGLSRLRANIQDWQPFFRDYVAPRFFGDVIRNFETEGGYVGGWAPLSPRYAAWKAKRYPGKGILQRTGRMINSLRWGGSPGPEMVFRMTPREAELGTSVPYAASHQRGTGRLPRRQMLFFAKGASQGYGRLLQLFVEDVISASGLRYARATPTSRLL